MSPKAAGVCRPGTGNDEIRGVRPRSVFTPASAAEAAEVLAEAAREALCVAFVGGGTDLGLGARPERLDALIRTERLDRILEHAPSDQIVVVEAGVRLGALQRTLAAHGQRLALDPPLPDRATIGGIVASNAFGPLRGRYGGVRDLILGVTIIRADGTPARSGGKVVKNVAGFDLPKLFVGSLGTLGLISSATFRLHPLPEIVTTVLVPGCSPAGIRRLLAAIRGAQLEPAAAAALGHGGALDVGIRFEGFAAGVRQQVEKLAAVAAAGGAGRPVLDDGAAAEFWSRHDALRAAGTFRARVAALPTALEPVVSDALPGLLAGLEHPGLVWYPTLGLGFVSGGASRPETLAAAIAAARRVLDRLGGSLVVHAAPASLADHERWGEPPASVALMRAVKERFDPDRRVAPGRFVGGI